MWGHYCHYRRQLRIRSKLSQSDVQFALTHDRHSNAYSCRSLDQPFAQPREVGGKPQPFSPPPTLTSTHPLALPPSQLLGHGLEEVLEGVAAIMADNRIRNPDTREKLLAGAAGVMEHRCGEIKCGYAYEVWREMLGGRTPCDA